MAGFPFLLFDFGEGQGRNHRKGFQRPVEIIAAHHVNEVRPALKRVQQWVEQGFYAAGYVSYEASPAFHPAMEVREGAIMPLLWFAVFREPDKHIPASTQGDFRLAPWRPMVSRPRYDADIAAIREAIARGETYQVNYTLRLRSRFQGDDLAFYEKLRAAQKAPYSAYLNLGRFRILSVSPELFFQKTGSTITTRPMKGTAKRGRWREEDERQAVWLKESEKNRAENLMIVDLLRNDLGSIAKTGSVTVPSLFEVEKYPTVFQMTSTVTAELKENEGLEEIFAALFPCGSVTGAPKVSTMKRIAQLEDSPREVYTGAIGMVSPDGTAVFNVAIRTLWIDSETGEATYGAGGGITWDSNAEGEYEEALAKALVLTEESPDFELLESLRLENGQYWLLNGHLERLAASAAYFGFPLSLPEVSRRLQEHARANSTGVRKVRLLVSKEGSVRVESEPLTDIQGQIMEVALAKSPVSRHDRFLYHKTTHRVEYEKHKREHPDVFDVLLWNEEGEATEFTIGNLVIEKEGEWWTPARDSGLLAGVYRNRLLEEGKLREGKIRLSDVQAANKIWLINSVRGWIPVRLRKQGK